MSPLSQMLYAPAKAALFEDAQQDFPSEWRDLGYAILIVGAAVLVALAYRFFFT